jgi:hypothetical protein
VAGEEQLEKSSANLLSLLFPLLVTSDFVAGEDQLDNLFHLLSLLFPLLVTSDFWLEKNS